jgi:hypothetical protein
MGASGGKRRLERRVAEAAQRALDDRQAVSALDVFLGLGWLAPGQLERWRQGRVPSLESAIGVGPGEVADALLMLHRWAEDRGLTPTPTEYVARTRDRRALRFTEDATAEVERAYRTHWVSADLSDARRQRLSDRASKPPDLVVIAPLNAWTCTGCDGTGDLLILEDPGPLCLTCADLDHLVYLPAGDAALTRRARKASALSAVVVRFSRSRRRYERQGVLVEEPALEAAERSCLADADARARRRVREADRRAAGDAAFVARLAAAIQDRYPGCPTGRVRAIAEHTALRGSGRVGRSAAARDLDPGAIDLAVAASVRHRETPYDALLMTGTDRSVARDAVRDQVTAVLHRWRSPPDPA